MKKLIGCIREYRLPTYLTLIFMTLEAYIETQIPTITAQLVNKIQQFDALSGDLTGNEMTHVVRTGFTLFVMALISLICGGSAGFTSAKASAGFAKNVRREVFVKVQDFSFENIDKFSTSSLVTRLTTDINHIQMAYMMLIRTAVRAPLMMFFSITRAYKMAGKLATTFVVIIPILVVGLLLIGKFALPAFRRVFKRYDLFNERIEENIRGMRVVKGFAREDYEIARFEKEAEGIRKDFTFAERVIAMNGPIMQLCLNFNMVFVLYVGSKMVITSRGADLGIGQISAMLTYGMQTLMSLMMFSMIFVIITISAESVKRISEVLNEQPSLTNGENPVTEIADGSIEFEGVNFKYSQKAKKNALEDLNIKIDSGMTVGILGGTGSGKTTLVQLIPRLYDVTEGSVKVGDKDVREYDIKSLRDSVAMVLQKNLLFSGTIAENLRWGNPNATQEELEQASKLAQAHGFITSFPDGYDTKIQQGGTNVSGGQRQRLCIARALLKKPKILILDDSTSAVDTKTDALIRRGFKEYIPETTKIIIAQRVASVEDADIIFVMDNGKVVAKGTHDELLENCEIYQEIHRQQTSGGDFDEQ